MIRLCHNCGSERHSRGRFCEECANDLMRKRMTNAYRIATIVPRETSEPDAAEIALGLVEQGGPAHAEEAQGG
jgi:hypothetical protein